MKTIPYLTGVLCGLGDPAQDQAYERSPARSAPQLNGTQNMKQQSKSYFLTPTFQFGAASGNSATSSEDDLK